MREKLYKNIRNCNACIAEIVREKEKSTSERERKKRKKRESKREEEKF